LCLEVNIECSLLAHDISRIRMLITVCLVWVDGIQICHIQQLAQSVGFNSSFGFYLLSVAMAQLVGSIGSLGPFRPESGKWANYKMRLDQYCFINGVEESKRKKALLMTVGG